MRDHLPQPAGTTQGHCQSSLHTAGLCSTWCPPGAPSPLQPRCFPDRQHPAHLGARGCPSPRTGLRQSAKSFAKAQLLAYKNYSYISHSFA